MSGPLTHAAVGAVAGMAPDAALALFVRRNRWVSEDSLLFRLHRFMHQPEGLLVVVGVGWATHLVLDRYSLHRTSPDAVGRRGWRW